MQVVMYTGGYVKTFMCVRTVKKRKRWNRREVFRVFRGNVMVRS